MHYIAYCTKAFGGLASPGPSGEAYSTPSPTLSSWTKGKRKEEKGGRRRRKEGRGKVEKGREGR